MKYYYKNEQLIPLDNINDIALYNDKHDIRNYAFIYVYPNGYTEKVLRSNDLYYHNLAIQSLHKISPFLHNYLSKKEVSDFLHFDNDVKMALKGVMTIYYNESNISNLTDIFGYINLPRELSEPQKKYLKDHLEYFKVYEAITIGQVKEEDNDFIAINEEGEEFMQLLNEAIKGTNLTSLISPKR